MLLRSVHGNNAGRHHVSVRDQMLCQLFVNLVGIAADLSRNGHGIRARCHLTDREPHAALDHGLERDAVVRQQVAIPGRPVGVRRRRLLCLGIGEFRSLRDRRAVLRPHRIAVGKRRRPVADADNHRQIAVCETVPRSVGGEIIVREEDCSAECRGRRGVEKKAMPTGHLIEPVVLGVATGLPNSRISFRSPWRLRGRRPCAQCRAERGDAAAQPR